MAKAKKTFVRLKCSVCGRAAYTTKKSRAAAQSKLELKKFCPKCRKHTLHKETKV